MYVDGMIKTKTIQISGQTWILHPGKAVYWEETSTLILTDMHLGKSGHFRKSGIAAPGTVNSRNLERLSRLLKEFNPDRVLILGDLFHSSANRDWLEFEEWIEGAPKTRWQLITGNHDTLHSSFYEAADMITDHELVEKPFHFIHDATDESELDNEHLIRVSGHIHPGISLKGKGRQALRLPCFLFSESNNIILPAFGEFTGLQRVRPEETDRVFAVVESQVIELNLTKS
jgi:DNA ligase-associated metallophosphoesterase